MKPLIYRLSAIDIALQERKKERKKGEIEKKKKINS
jgi:hypothetical protein